MANREDPAQQAQAPEVSARPSRRDPPPWDEILRGLVVGVPLTVLLFLFARWGDRDYIPVVLTRLSYPAALTVGCVGTAAWTRFAVGRRSTPELELTVVAVTVAVSLAVVLLLRPLVD